MTIDLIFIIDICINFNTGFVLDSRSQLVEYDRWLVAKHYLETWSVALSPIGFVN